MNRNKILLSLIFLVLSTALFAETFSFSSDKLKTSIADGREKVRLTGKVIIESEKRKIEADQVDMWGDNYNFFAGNGSIRVEDKERNIILQAEEFFFDKGADIMRLSGLVIMEDYENEMVIKCQYMENRAEEELIILQVGVRILKDDIVCRSEYAIFNRAINMLELSGLPIVFKSDDKYQADIIEVNLDTDEINLSGQVEGSLTTKSKEKEEGDSEDSDTEDGKENRLENPEGEAPPELQEGDENPESEPISEPEPESTESPLTEGESNE